MCIKKNISGNIKLLMGQKNIKAWSELAKQCNITVPAMQRIINQKTDSPGINTLKAIADFFNISVDALISKALTANRLTSNTSKSLPLFDDLQISKWLRLENDIAPTKNDNVITVDDTSFSSQSFAYKILDGNLSPIIPENSTLIVDTKQAPRHKDYVLLKYPGFKNIVVRQLLTDGVDKYTIPIISVYNNTPHEKLASEVAIIGVVVKISIYFR